MSTSTPSLQRAVLFPVSDSDCCSSALRWALENVARPADVFHLAYVMIQKSSPLSSPRASQLSPPCNPFCPAEGENSQLAARAELHSSRAMIQRRFSPLLEEARIPFEVHLLEPAELAGGGGSGSGSEGVGGALVNLAALLGAALVVVGGGLKGSAARRGGPSCGCSVTKFCLDRCPATVCVVRGVCAR